MSGAIVEFPSNGTTGNGYLAVPASGSGPGVIVLQEWWGLVDHIKAVAGPVLAQRLVLREGMEFSVDKEELLQQIVRDMEVPPWK